AGNPWVDAGTAVSGALRQDRLRGGGKRAQVLQGQQSAVDHGAGDPDRVVMAEVRNREVTADESLLGGRDQAAECVGRGLGIVRIHGQNPAALRRPGWKKLELMGQPAPPPPGKVGRRGQPVIGGAPNGSSARLTGAGQASSSGSIGSSSRPEASFG